MLALWLLFPFLSLLIRPWQSASVQDLFIGATDVVRVLLLTAHPDDECMFFAPTLLALRDRVSVEVFSLCLSVGNADGLGQTRRHELSRSLDVLGVDASRRWVVDVP